jgi:hypothetical protein
MREGCDNDLPLDKYGELDRNKISWLF